MDLFSIFTQLKDNLQFFNYPQSDISSRYRILIDETLTNLECTEDSLDDESFINIRALRSRSWDIIHTGKWSDVAATDKYLYSLSTYLEVLADLREFLISNPDPVDNKERSRVMIEQCIESMDMGILLGCPVPDQRGMNLFCSGASLLSRFLNTIVDPVEFPERIINKQEARETYNQNDIPAEDLANILDNFKDQFYTRSQPVLIRNSFRNWPATEKWRDISYFQQNFGFRTVPIEIGSQYTTTDWGQELMLFKDFLANQFGNNGTSGPVQYLAQHDLFEQIPELKEDIEYPQLLTQSLQIPLSDVEVKVWLGPSGTVSPLHYDKKENFLCQVIGWKRIILISPEDSQFLYPYDGEMMSNTSQLDLSAVNGVDKDKFPLAGKAKHYNVILGPQETLFIPFGWWHHVTSLSPSISVSFWWNKN